MSQQRESDSARTKLSLGAEIDSSQRRNLVTSKEVLVNRKAWNQIARAFAGVCALPNWGPFGEGADRDWLGSVADKLVMEIGCGSGHSIHYLAKQEPKKIIGVDFSAQALAIATNLNQTEMNAGRIELIEAPMEERLEVRDIDVVFSIHALGWTLEPYTVFSNIASYLKPGGKFIWSGGHPMFSRMRYEDGAISLHKPYFDEAVDFEPNWCGSDGVYMVTRTISSWFGHLRAAGFVVNEFWEPQAALIENAPQDPCRFYSQTKLSNLPSTMIFVCEKPV